MKFRFGPLNLVVISCCLGLTVVPTAVMAQNIQSIEVTGSRIKRIDSETASPIQIITREQIDRLGAASVSEIMKSIPASNTGIIDGNEVASYTPGAGGVSLRGLGPQATLVLINGRRIAPFGFASGGQQTFVDVNSIPMDVIQRIEVLLDGASAIYGSDAMGGVVNIILRKDYQGFTLSANAGQSIAFGDAANQSVSATFGKGSLAQDGYNLMGNFSHNERDGVRATERPMSSTANFSRFGLPDYRSSYSYPGNLYTVGGSSGSGAAFKAPSTGCTPIADGSALNGRCSYDPAMFTDIIAKTQRDNLFLAGTFNLSGGNQLFGDLAIGRSTFLQNSASYSTSTYYSTETLPYTAITLPVGHPNNPYSTEMALRYRFADVPRTTEATTHTVRAVIGLKGTWMGWDGQTALVHSTSNTSLTYKGFINDRVLLSDVLDTNYKAKNSFVFGNPSANSASLMSRLYPSLSDTGKTSTVSADISGSRELMQLAGGPLSIAVGGEVRRESFMSTPDPMTASGAISVLGSAGANGNRTVSSVYTELSAPIVKNLETSLAARIDNYSDFGSAVTPKASAKWKIAPNFALRGTYSEGFRAPALTETSSSPGKGFYSGLTDPKLCPTPDVNNENCHLSVESISGSNPKLKPEYSKSRTIGFVWDPVENVSLTVDSFRIKRRDEISSIDPDYLMAHEADYPGFVVRDPSTGVIKQFNLLYTNLGSTSIKGTDVDLRFRQNLDGMGQLTYNMTYNRLPKYLVAAVKGAAEEQWAGTYTQPIERIRFATLWDFGPWVAGLTLNHTGSFSRAYTYASMGSCPYANTSRPEYCTVENWDTVDLFVGYKGIQNLDLGMTLQNIENKTAPYDDRRLARYTLYSPMFHNALGRYMSIRAKYSF